MRAATGFDRRTADAVAMNCWVSRGLVIHGFEFKSNRSDWLQELKRPEKQDQSIYPFCHRWWLVVGDPQIVKDGELPDTWGLMVPHKQGLKVKVKAPKLAPRAPTRGFIASVLRSVRDKAELPQKSIDDAYKEGYKAGTKAQTELSNERKDSSVKIWKERHDRLQKTVQEFQQSSGLFVDKWSGPRIGEFFRLIESQDPSRVIARLRDLYKQQERFVHNGLSQLEQAEAQFQEFKKTRR